MTNHKCKLTSMIDGKHLSEDCPICEKGGKKGHGLSCSWYKEDGSPCDCGLTTGMCEFEKCKKKAKYLATGWHLCKEHVFSIYGVKEFQMKRIRKALRNKLV